MVLQTVMHDQLSRLVSAERYRSVVINPEQCVSKMKGNWILVCRLTLLYAVSAEVCHGARTINMPVVSCWRTSISCFYRV